MDEHIKDLLHEFIAHSSENGDLTKLTEFISVGFIVDNDDPLQQGRLKIFCPAYNDDPKKLLHLPWCSYVSPVGGVISNTDYTRGHIPGTDTSSGPIHYGFWAIPEIGSQALVACINGDARRRVWLGCIPSHQETHTIGTGRYKHSGGAVDGPLTSEGNPIQPTYSKLQEAFNGETNSAEWKTRGADYQITALYEPPSPDKTVYVDDDLAAIQGSEEDSWVTDILGEHGYDWTSYKNLGSFLTSKVYTWNTPGFHSFTMDDRAFNSRIRFRTAGGNQIILDDTNERIYFSTSGGKSWIEMDAAGNIDLYAERNISLHAEKALNLSGGESVRLRSPGFISLAAGDSPGTPLDAELVNGEIRMHAQDDMHITTDTNLRYNVGENMLGLVGQEHGVDVGGDFNVQSAGSGWLQSTGNWQIEAPNIVWKAQGRVDTSVNHLIAYIDSYVSEYNSHTHTDTAGTSAGTTTPPNSAPFADIQNEGNSANPSPSLDETEIAPWTNRVPMHEPWPRTMMIDSGDSQNASSSRPNNNVDWIPQYDNQGQAGREKVGKSEGQDTIDRGTFWRR